MYSFKILTGYTIIQIHIKIVLHCVRWFGVRFFFSLLFIVWLMRTFCSKPTNRMTVQSKIFGCGCQSLKKIISMLQIEIRVKAKRNTWNIQFTVHRNVFVILSKIYNANWKLSGKFITQKISLEKNRIKTETTKKNWWWKQSIAKQCDKRRNGFSFVLNQTAPAIFDCVSWFLLDKILVVGTEMVFMPMKSGLSFRMFRLLVLDSMISNDGCYWNGPK